MSKNSLEDTSIINTSVLEVIDLLISKSNDIVFCGSISLNALGILKRQIHDIDILIPKNLSIEDHAIWEIIQSHCAGIYLSDIFRDINGEKIIRNSIIINNIKIDIFKIESLNYSEINFFDRKIKIQNINDVILAKKAWSIFAKKNFKKHLDDLDEIEINLRKKQGTFDT